MTPEGLIIRIIIALGIFVILPLIYFKSRKNKNFQNDNKQKYLNRIHKEFKFDISSSLNTVEISSQRIRWDSRSLLLYLFPFILIIPGLLSKNILFLIIGFIAFFVLGFVNHASFKMVLSKPGKIAKLEWRWLGIPYRKTLAGEQLQGLFFSLVDVYWNQIYRRTEGSLMNPESEKKRKALTTLSFRADQAFIDKANAAIDSF